MRIPVRHLSGQPDVLLHLDRELATAIEELPVSCAYCTAHHFVSGELLSVKQKTVRGEGEQRPVRMFTIEWEAIHLGRPFNPADPERLMQLRARIEIPEVALRATPMGRSRFQVEYWDWVQLENIQLSLEARQAYFDLLSGPFSSQVRRYVEQHGLPCSLSPNVSYVYEMIQRA